MYFKLKVNKSSIRVLGVVEDKKDDEFVYATEQELKLINPQILTNLEKGINDFIVSKG